MRGAAFVAIVALITASQARAEGPKDRAILLLSQVGDPPVDATRHIDALIKAMGATAPVSGNALRDAIAERFSRSAGPTRLKPNVRSRVEEGRREFIEGNYQKAITILGQMRAMLLRRVATVASDQGYRDSLHQTLLFLAHAYLRAKQPERATELAGEAVRAFADRELSPVQHSPDLVHFYKKVRSVLNQKERGSLQVVTRPPGCMVFVNERFVGLSPTNAANLHTGRHRLYIQRGNQRGRVHDVMISGGDEKVVVDFEFDRRLQNGPMIGLRFDDAQDRRQREERYAARLGQGLGAATVILISFDRHENLRTLDAAVVSAATGRTVRAARVALEPTNPSPETYSALGRFLMGGQASTRIIVRLTRQSDTKPSTSNASGFFSARVFRWISGGVAVGLLGAGITLIALDGTGTCDAPEGVACPELYETKGLGIGLTVAGGLVAAASGYLFFRAARTGRAERHAVLLPWLTANAGGLTSAFRF